MALTTTRQIDVKDFARRVERVCDFILAKVSAEQGRDGSADLRILERLKEDAADIQFDRLQIVTHTIEGLHDYVTEV